VKYDEHRRGRGDPCRAVPNLETRLVCWMTCEPLDIKPTPLTLYRGDSGGWKSILLKDETKQTTGSFKFRSVFQKMNLLGGVMDVVTASTGNHGLAVAAGSNFFGQRAHVFVPARTPPGKIQGLRSLRAQVTLVDRDYGACVIAAKAWASERNATYIESFEDPEIIQGHRHLLYEIDDAGHHFDVCFAPIGGGGLLAACLLHWRETKTIVVGVEAGRAPAMKMSLAQGRRVRLSDCCSIAEGIALPTVGSVPFGMCRTHPPRIVTVSEEEITRAIKLLWAYNGIRAEGAGAASLAAALKSHEESQVCLCIVTGGNIDRSQFQAITST
jgi:threonine dehydratase